MIEFQFFLEVLVGGLLSGVMYSLVAIGFALIYKTSGVLNFAQGAMLLSASLTFVSLVERDVPFWLAFAITLAAMALIGIGIERTVLRPLVNQPPITLFMATLGLSYVIEGVAQLLWGTQVHGLDLGIEDLPLDFGGVFVSTFDLFAAATAALMVTLLTVFFRYTRVGLAFRAVADDQLAVLAVRRRPAAARLELRRGARLVDRRRVGGTAPAAPPHCRFRKSSSGARPRLQRQQPFSPRNGPTY